MAAGRRKPTSIQDNLQLRQSNGVFVSQRCACYDANRKREHSWMPTEDSRQFDAGAGAIGAAARKVGRPSDEITLIGVSKTHRPKRFAAMRRACAILRESRARVGRKRAGLEDLRRAGISSGTAE